MTRRRSPRSARDIYDHAVRLIAHNDNPVQSNANDLPAIGDYSSVRLIAELFDADPRDVARTVLGERRAPVSHRMPYRLPNRRPKPQPRVTVTMEPHTPYTPFVELPAIIRCPECEGVAADEVSEQGATWETCDACRAEPGAHTVRWETWRAEVLSDPDESTEHDSHADAVRAVLAMLDSAAQDYFENDDRDGYSLARDLQRDVRALRTDEPWQDTSGHYTYILRPATRPQEVSR